MINYTNYGMNLLREIFGSFVAISDFLHMIGQSTPRHRFAWKIGNDIHTVSLI